MTRRDEINAEIRRRIASRSLIRRLSGSSRPYLLLAVVLAVLAFTGGRISVDAAPVYQTFQVDPPQIKAREPRVVTRWRDRIVFREIEPEFVATAPGGGEDRIIEFCRDSGLAVPDTTTAPEQPVTRFVYAGRLNRGWLPFSSDRVNLFSLGSDASTQESEWRTHGSFEFVTDQTVVLRGSRFWYVKELVRVGLPFAAGYATGKVFP